MKKLLFLILFLITFTSNSMAGTYMFRSHSSRIKSWLEAKGYGGSVYDALNSYFSDISGIEGTLYDKVHYTLDQQGYTGTMQDKLNQFFQSKTGSTGRGDAERSFWSNNTLSFSFDSILLDDGSSYLVLDDGLSKILL